MQREVTSIVTRIVLRGRYLEDGVEEVCGVHNVGGDERNKMFEVVVDIFGEAVSEAITARDDGAAWNVRFVEFG